MCFVFCCRYTLTFTPWPLVWKREHIRTNTLCRDIYLGFVHMEINSWHQRTHEDTRAEPRSKNKKSWSPALLQGVWSGSSGWEKMAAPIRGWSLAELRRPRRGGIPGATGTLDTYKAKALDLKKPVYEQETHSYTTQRLWSLDLLRVFFVFFVLKNTH